MKKRTSKSWKRKGLHAVKRQSLHPFSRNYPLPIYASTINDLTRRTACQTNVPMAKFAPMKTGATFLAISSLALCPASAQTPTPDAAKSTEAAQLEALAKKIDEQNTKIDALSQELLKLEQQLSHVRPGVMIGEGAPAPATAGAAASAAAHPSVTGNTHTVARGETLTSIAKMYKVTVDDLQKANNIEDGRKLQAGQTIVIPTSSPPASGSSSP
jgi:LysM repeat protein